MSRFLIALVLSVAMTGLAASASAHDKPQTPTAKPAATPPDRQQSEAIAVVEKFHAAIKAGDSKLAEQVLAADVHIFEQGHRESSRAEYLSHHFKEDAAFAKVVPSTTTTQQARVMGDIALVMTESSSEGTYKEKPVKTASVATYVLAKREGQWQVVHIHWSSRKRS